LIKGTFAFTKINQKGENPPWSYSPAPLKSNTLPDPSDQNLLTIRQHEPADDPLSPGETLVLTLKLAGTPPAPPPPIAVAIPPDFTLSLNLPIVAEPVNPVPEAGYALLRGSAPSGKTPDSFLECVRFAFSPDASRIELIDPNDLRRQNVRRRAVFLWRDTPRVGRSCVYAIQKITTGGSTHFPPLPKKP
jgi:hypothetical protein